MTYTDTTRSIIQNTGPTHFFFIVIFRPATHMFSKLAIWSNRHYKLAAVVSDRGSLKGLNAAETQTGWPCAKKFGRNCSKYILENLVTVRHVPIGFSRFFISNERLSVTAKSCVDIGDKSEPRMLLEICGILQTSRKALRQCFPCLFFDCCFIVALHFVENVEAYKMGRLLLKMRDVAIDIEKVAF